MDDISQVASWVAQQEIGNALFGKTLNRRHSDFYPNECQGSDDSELSDSDLEELNFTSSEEDEYENIKRPKHHPNWFLCQSFQYNWRMSFVSLPGLILILALTGDVFIFIVTIGCFLMYLFHEGGHRSSLILTFCGMFMCCQFYIIYSTLPLLWLSIFNSVLVALISLFWGLTWAWLALNFLELCQADAEATKLLETIVFTIYPAVAIALWTWIITSMTSISLAPYCVLIIGFVIFQQFLTPTRSSFVKISGDHNMCPYILDSQLVGAVALAYMTVTPTIFLLVAASGGVSSILSLHTLAEWIFVGSLAVFGGTLMNIRPFLQSAEIEYQTLLQARWCSGLLSLLLLSIVLHKHHFTLYLIPWISMAIAIHAAYGFVVGKKRLKKWSFLIGLLLLSMYAVIFSKLPWAVHYYVSGNIHISLVHSSLLLNVVLCILCAYMSTSGSSESFGLIFTVQNLCFVSCEKLLMNNDMYMSAVMFCSALLIIYVIIRLSISKTLPEQYVWLLSSLQITKLLDHCDSLLQAANDSSIHWNVYSTVATLVATLTLTKILLLHGDSLLSYKQYCKYMMISLGAICLSIPVFAYKICLLIERDEPTYSDLFGLTLSTVAMVSIKLYMSVGCEWKGAKHVGPAALLSSFVLLHFQAEIFSSDPSEFKKVLLVVNIVASFYVISSATMVKAPKTLGLLAMVLGLPLGLCIALWFYPGRLSGIMYILYSSAAALCISLALMAYRQPFHLQEYVNYRCIFTALLCVSLLAVDVLSPTPNVLIQPGSACCIFVLFFFASLFKFLSFNKKATDLTKGILKSNTAIPGNIITLFLYINLLFVWKLYYIDIWAILCSPIFLLLQPDGYILTHHNIKSHASSFSITSVILMLSSYYNNQLWFETSTFGSFIGFMDLAVTSSQLCTQFIFLSVLWTNRPYLSNKWVVFALPLPLLYIFFSSSYSCCLFGVYSFVGSLWLMKCKLDLTLRHDVTIY